MIKLFTGAVLFLMSVSCFAADSTPHMKAAAYRWIVDNGVPYETARGALFFLTWDYGSQEVSVGLWPSAIGVAEPTRADLTNLVAQEDMVVWQERQEELLQPVDQPQSIAIPSSTSNLYYSIEVTDDGELFTALAHASPYDPAAHQQRIADKYNALRARKQARLASADEAATAATNAANASSVIALREEVRRLAAIIEELLRE